MAEKEKKTGAETATPAQEAGSVQPADFDALAHQISRELAVRFENFLREWLDRLGPIEDRLQRVMEELEARVEATFSTSAVPLSADAVAPVSPDDKVRVKVFCTREKGFYRASRFWPGRVWTDAQVHSDDLQQLKREPQLMVEVLHSTD